MPFFAAFLPGSGEREQNRCFSAFDAPTCRMKQAGRL
jgi:hypothetical protein